MLEEPIGCIFGGLVVFNVSSVILKPVYWVVVRVVLFEWLCSKF